MYSTHTHAHINTHTMFLQFLNIFPVHPSEALGCQLSAQAGGLQPPLTPSATPGSLFQRTMARVCNTERWAKFDLLLLSCCSKHRNTPKGIERLSIVHHLPWTLIPHRAEPAASFNKTSGLKPCILISFLRNPSVQLYNIFWWRLTKQLNILFIPMIACVHQTDSYLMTF